MGALALVLLAASLGLAQVQLLGPPMGLLQPYRPPLAERVSPVETVTAYELYRQGALFVDARERERYEAGHVPGAVQADPDGDLAMLPYGKVVVVYCDGPECGASARLAARLAQLRTGKTLVMTAGWPGWLAAGYPVKP